MQTAQKLRIKSPHNAFTLIELLIVISLIIMMTGVLLPGFSNYIDNQNTRQAAKFVQDYFRTVQNKALSGENILQQDGAGDTVLYWGVKADRDSGVLTEFVSVNNSSSCSQAPERLLESVSSKIPGNNLILSSSRCIYFDFKAADTTSVVGNTIIIGPEDATGNICRSIVVNTNGRIDIAAGVGCP